MYVCIISILNGLVNGSALFIIYRVEPCVITHNAHVSSSSTVQDGLELEQHPPGVGDEKTRYEQTQIYRTNKEIILEVIWNSSLVPSLRRGMSVLAVWRESKTNVEDFKRFLLNFPVTGRFYIGSRGGAEISFQINCLGLVYSPAQFRGRFSTVLKWRFLNCNLFILGLRSRDSVFLNNFYNIWFYSKQPNWQRILMQLDLNNRSYFICNSLIGVYL